MSLPDPHYGTYCPTCYQFVPEKYATEVEREEKLGPFWRAFSEIYDIPFRMVRRWDIRPTISVLAGQVMANDMKRAIEDDTAGVSRKRDGNGRFVVRG